MSKYICDRCGKVRDAEDLGTIHQYVGDCGSSHAYEDVTDWDCPCGGMFVEAVKCPKCGEYCDPEETYGEKHICLECLKEEATIGNAFEFEKECLLDGEKYLEQKFDCMGYSLEDVLDLIEKDIKERLKTEYLPDNARLVKTAERVCLGFDKDEFADWLTEKEEIKE